MVETVGRFELHSLPDGAGIYFDPKPHAYYGEVKPNGKSEGGYSAVKDSRLAGVSTAAKALDGGVSDPLIHWGTKLERVGFAEICAYALDQGEDMAWLRDPEAIRSRLYAAKRAWHHIRDRAATRGTNVHERIFAALARDEAPTLADLSDEERNYGQAAMRFWRDYDPVPIHVEQVTAWRELGVAGRFDLLCEIDGRRTLIDAKTREKDAARRTDHVQLAGYEACNEACGIGISERQWILVLLPDGSYSTHPGLAEKGDFLAALDAYRCGRSLEQRMKAAE